ncbi:hypothetical protein [Lyngbya aestuarii]|uniref:hypothetical protein n=1 Tax=Lyngbya aestuarii TaxID=118322 RepID=UPI00403E0FF6
MKLGILTITGLMLTGVFIAPAQAQRRICIVGERSNDVVCGRPATEREIRSSDNWQYDQRRPTTRDDLRRLRPREDVNKRINEIYREVLGRNADSGGLRTYGERVTSGDWDYEKVRDDLADSREARDKINQIYREILRRDVDNSGLKTYTNRLREGWSLADVRRDLANSREARQIQQGTEVRDNNRRNRRR